MGGSFGMSEGIISNSSEKIRAGLIMGVIIGSVGGMLGFIAGQAALLLIGTYIFNSSVSFKHFGIPLSRALGWAVFGIWMGLVEGVRSKSAPKIRNGIIGGFLGGLLGGLVVEYLRVFSPANSSSRLFGLCTLGLFIGISYGLVERGLARASLRMLSGRDRGREFLLTQRTTRVGGAQSTEVTLAGYRNVSKEHAEIRREGNNFTIVQGEGKKPLYVNDEKVSRTVLSDGDVVRIGDAQVQFSTKLQKKGGHR
jgi:hypothetical protein